MMMSNKRVDICQLANYNAAVDKNRSHLSGILKQQRISLSLTLQDLSARSAVSASHLGRIERGERFPSARILRKIAKPLGFTEDEIFTLAGYLSPQPSGIAEERPPYGSERLDPYVARVLAQEPVEIQRAVLGILAILKSLAKGMKENNR
ncbi:MAG: helix-turn-helix transcriptional regulator [Chloroflexota bacterium]